MAVVQQPFGAVQASGSVAGMTALITRSGQILRQRRRPVQPRTSSVQDVRYNFASFNRMFQSLTAEEIQAWNDFGATWTIPGKLGSNIKVTGLNWFINFSVRLQKIGVTPPTAPPLNPNSDYFPELSVALTGSPASINLTISPLPTGDETIWVYYTGFLPLSSRFQKGSIRLRQIITSSATSPVTLIAAADIPNENCRVQFKFVAVDGSGRATPPLNQYVDIKAA